MALFTRHLLRKNIVDQMKSIIPQEILSHMIANQKQKLRLQENHLKLLLTRLSPRVVHNRSNKYLMMTMMMMARIEAQED